MPVEGVVWCCGVCGFWTLWVRMSSGCLRLGIDYLGCFGLCCFCRLWVFDACLDLNFGVWYTVVWVGDLSLNVLGLV